MTRIRIRKDGPSCYPWQCLVRPADAAWEDTDRLRRRYSADQEVTLRLAWEELKVLGR